MKKYIGLYVDEDGWTIETCNSKTHERAKKGLEDKIKPITSYFSMIILEPEDLKRLIGELMEAL